MRAFVGLLIIVALAGVVWVARLPDKEECVATGRVVDPTERHCLSGTGYQQLQEHALFHSREVVLGSLLLLAGGYGIRRYLIRRRSRSAPPPA